MEAESEGCGSDSDTSSLTEPTPTCGSGSGAAYAAPLPAGVKYVQSTDGQLWPYLPPPVTDVSMQTQPYKAPKAPPLRHRPYSLSLSRAHRNLSFGGHRHLQVSVWLPPSLSLPLSLSLSLSLFLSFSLTHTNLLATSTRTCTCTCTYTCACVCSTHGRCRMHRMSCPQKCSVTVM